MDYKNGKIYKLWSPNTDKVYIGSTTQPLFKRLSKHKWNYTYWKKGGKTEYMTSFEIFDYGEVKIELIEEYPCENKMYLNKREGETIRSIDCVNKIKKLGIPMDNAYYNEYYANNSDRIKESNKKYKEANKDKEKAYREANKDKRKAYIETNKEHIAKKNKEYKEANKDRAKEIRSQKVKCELCEKEMTKGSLNRHIKRKH
jgi:hypothetical protein